MFREKSHRFLLWMDFLFDLFVFTSDHHTFCSLFKVKRHAIACINNGIIVGLCSKLFMRLSYYIHAGKKLSTHIGIESRPLRLWAVYFTIRPERWLCLPYCIMIYFFASYSFSNVYNIDSRVSTRQKRPLRTFGRRKFDENNSKIFWRLFDEYLRWIMFKP